MLLSESLPAGKRFLWYLGTKSAGNITYVLLTARAAKQF
jgi:hypothetical protein